MNWYGHSLEEARAMLEQLAHVVFAEGHRATGIRFKRTLRRGAQYVGASTQEMPFT